MFIEWSNEKHSLGIELIDNQHKQLFILTNQLHDILDLEHYQAEAIKVLKRLYAYSSYHFTSEEGLFKEYNYPEAKEHINIHNTFKNKIKEFLEGIRDKKNFRLAPLQDYLVEWILHHVQGEDVKYTKFFTNSSIKADIHFTISDEKRNDVLSQWKQRKLSLEIIDIDNQHKELVYILQQTNDLQHTSDSRKRIYLPTIIKKMFYYSQFHFSYEEEHMAKNNFPLLKEHQEIHKKFIREVMKFAEDYSKGKQKLTDDIVLFLKDWTITHILTEDKKYKDHLDSIS